MGCCSSRKTTNAATRKKSGTAISSLGVSSTATTSNRPRSAAGQTRNTGPRDAANGLLNPHEQYRVRSREKAIQALINTFGDNESLVPSPSWRRQYVKLAGIGPDVAVAIAERIEGKTVARKRAGTFSALSTPHRIVTLDLRALRVGDDGLAALGKALARDSVVENVILSGNQITDVGAESFAAAITAAAAASAGSGGGALRAAGSGCPSQLRLLVLADNPISSAGIATLASCLDKLPVLRRLEVGRGRLGEENESDGDTIAQATVESLVRLIDASPSLQTLVFKGTGNPWRPDFSPACLAAFVSQVVSQSRLSSLFLQDCFTTKPMVVNTTTVVAGRLRAEADATPSASPSGSDPTAYLQPISALSTAITVRTTRLSTLVLRFPLNDSAMAILCKGIAHAMLLANLSLRGCELSATGLRLLGDALHSNRTISALDVSYQSHLIAHPIVLQELRSSSKRRQSFSSGYIDLRETQNSSGTDSLPSRSERDRPLLPIIKVCHTNRTITQLIMLGVNISVDDVEELCSCIEQSENHVLTEVAYTSIGADALNMKLESFLSANREYGGHGGASTVGQRSMVRAGSTGTLFGDTVTEDRSQVSDGVPSHFSSVVSGGLRAGKAGESSAKRAKAVGPQLPKAPTPNRDVANASASATDDFGSSSAPSMPPPQSSGGGRTKNLKGDLFLSYASLTSKDLPMCSSGNEVAALDDVELRVDKADLRQQQGDEE